MSKKSDYRYVRVTATVSGSYRNRGIGLNLSKISDVTEMFEKLEDADLSNVVAIRIKPTEVNISSAKDAATFIDGASGRSW